MDAAMGHRACFYERIDGGNVRQIEEGGKRKEKRETRSVSCQRDAGTVRV
jgi:hypothetical protein